MELFQHGSVKPEYSADVPYDLAAVVGRIRTYISENGLKPNDRLPPERDLALKMDLPRGMLRRGLAFMGERGEVWRHVGKGTFVGRSSATAVFTGAQLIGTTPSEVIESRLVLEPRLAAFAALRATSQDIARLQELAAKSRTARSFEEGQKFNDALHRTIAVAARNELLLWMFDGLFSIRAATNWGRLLPVEDTAQRDRYCAEHERCVEAIAVRDVAGAETAMRGHIESLRKHIEAQVPKW